jgi:hypothetical protein
MCILKRRGTPCLTISQSGLRLCVLRNFSTTHCLLFIKCDLNQSMAFPLDIMKVKVKVFCYKPKVALGVPGG